MQMRADKQKELQDLNWSAKRFMCGDPAFNIASRGLL